MLEHIIANANLVICQFQEQTDFEFGYNQDSVEWIDGFIDRQRQKEDFTAEFGQQLTNTVGSFLGQCIVECHGGRWKETEYGWGIEFGEGNVAYPFSKTSKQFENGAEDSIYSFFTTIPILFHSTITQPDGQSEKKWWNFWG